VHYLLFYDVVDGYAERRMPFRAAHIAYARNAVDRGDLEIRLGGLGQKLRVRHCLVECPPQRLDSLLRHAGWRHKGPAHHLAGEDRLDADVVGARDDGDADLGTNIPGDLRKPGDADLQPEDLPRRDAGTLDPTSLTNGRHRPIWRVPAESSNAG
jgi:hypothetical protein